MAVARHRSFRKAAAELGVTPSAAGQAVRALETRLGVALFIRTTRSVGMTEAGERFLAEAEPAYQALAAAGAAASDLGGRPTGLLRLAVPRCGRAAHYQADPGIVRRRLSQIFELEIAASEEFIDIASHGVRRRHEDGTVHRQRHDRAAADAAVPHGRPSVAPDYLKKLWRAHEAGRLCKLTPVCRLRRTIGGASPWHLADKGKPLEDF